MKKPYTLDLSGDSTARDSALEAMMREARKDADGATYFADVGASDVLQVYTNDRLDDVRSRLVALRPDLSPDKAPPKPTPPPQSHRPSRFQRQQVEEPKKDEDNET